MSNVKVEDQNKPWKNEKYFNSYEEANEYKNILRAKDRSGMLQFKIKRCGLNGINYVVKSREDPNALAELAAIEEKMMKKKSKK
jgi:hypothetical protein